MDVLAQALVDLDLLLELFDYDRVLLLQFFVLFLLLLKLAFGNRLCAVEFRLFRGKLHVEAVELFDFFFLVNALLPKLDTGLFGHAHVVNNVLTVGSFLGKFGVVASNKRGLLSNLVLLLFDGL